MAVEFIPIQTHASSWDPASCRKTLNCCLDARIVPSMSTPEGARLDAAHLVVLDNLFGEPERTGLLESLNGGGQAVSAGPPDSKWERNTADDATASKTWGLKSEVLSELAAHPKPAMLEIQTRLAKLYPECTIAHMPSTQMQNTSSIVQSAAMEDKMTGFCQPSEAGQTVPDSDGQQNPTSGLNHQNGQPYCPDKINPGKGELGSKQESEHSSEVEGFEEPGVDCCSLLANAPVHGDHYEWHVDADPLTLPDSAWRRQFGDYCNREPGLPLLVSLLLYLVDDSWDRNLHAETLFLDSPTEVGIVVRPKRFRAVLMDQDVMHRVVAPSKLAEGHPRYSLVWKLAFLPRQPNQSCSIARPEWGPPTSIGSAARLDTVKRALLAGSKRRREAISGAQA